MKEQLIKLSKEIGFESIVKIDSLKSDKDNNIGVDDLNNYLEVGYCLWMCELQKWLREKYRLDVTAIPIIHNKEHIPSYFRTYKNSCTWMDCGQSETFEIALEKGLMESLKLIK